MFRVFLPFALTLVCGAALHCDLPTKTDNTTMDQCNQTRFSVLGCQCDSCLPPYLVVARPPGIAGRRRGFPPSLPSRERPRPQVNKAQCWTLPHCAKNMAFCADCARARRFSGPRGRTRSLRRSRERRVRPRVRGLRRGLPLVARERVGVPARRRGAAAPRRELGLRAPLVVAVRGLAVVVAVGRGNSS